MDCDPVQLSHLYEFNAHPAPPEPLPTVCFVTGRPAAYRDPRSGLPYSDVAALVELRRRIAASAAQAGVVPVLQQVRGGVPSGTCVVGRGGTQVQEPRCGSGCSNYNF